MFDIDIKIFIRNNLIIFIVLVYVNSKFATILSDFGSIKVGFFVNDVNSVSLIYGNNK